MTSETKSINELASDRITPREASEILGCSEYTLRQKVREGLIPHYRVGKRMFLRKSSLLSWIEEQELKNVHGNFIDLDNIRR
ncbi:MAG: helix-turn-helix domain-containing protein [Clostridia bacterium]